MVPIKKALNSSIGRKIINGLTAFGLVGFVIVHLAGNLTLYGGPEAFNRYAKGLHDLGWLLTAAEIGLFALFLFHIITGLKVTFESWNAREERYVADQESKGGISNLDFDSRNMIFSGLFLLLFTVVHVLHFRVGAWMDKSEYTTTIDGEQALDLYGMVDYAFAQPFWVGFYVIMMLALALHLRHGVWSMFQSLGLMNDQFTGPGRKIAFGLAVVLSIGFLFLPVYMYLT
jgi:succinate dehydrogenase / fumarate reductase cytochrome b subunit